MDTHEKPNTVGNDSTNGLDHIERCNTSQVINAEATGASYSNGIEHRNFSITEEIRGSVDKMTRLQVNSSPGNFKRAMRGTQTPLTLIGVAMAKYNEEELVPEPAVIPDTRDTGKTEISVALNSAPELLQRSSSSGESDNSKPSPSAVGSMFSQFRVEAVTVKFSHEAATQATPPHPSLTSTKSTPPPRDVLQIATSVSSNRSGPKSEVLTVTTDYGTRTPETRSLLMDVIEQDHPRRYINVEPSTPAIAVSNTSGIRPPVFSQLTISPPSIGGHRSMPSLDRRRRALRWNCMNCFGRNRRQREEPDELPYNLGPPPTYSGIFREGRSIFGETRFQLPPSLSNDTAASFVAPIPPPSYAQAQGLCMSPYSMDQLLSVTPTRGIWPSRPTATICSRCATVVVTVVEVRRSAITHVSAIVLFLCGCWPCCLIPYCIDSCKSTHHYCPVCRTYLGTHTPW